MNGILTPRERQLYGLLSMSLGALDVTCDKESTGQLHFRFKDAVVSVDRSEVAAAAESIEDLCKDVELRLRRATVPDTP